MQTHPYVLKNQSNAHNHKQMTHLHVHAITDPRSHLCALFTMHTSANTNIFVQICSHESHLKYF